MVRDNRIYERVISSRRWTLDKVLGNRGRQERRGRRGYGFAQTRVDGKSEQQLVQTRTVIKERQADVLPRRIFRSRS